MISRPLDFSDESTILRLSDSFVGLDELTGTNEEIKRKGYHVDLAQYKQLILHLRSTARRSSLPLSEVTSLMLTPIETWESGRLDEVKRLYETSLIVPNNIVASWLKAVLPKKRNCGDGQTADVLKRAQDRVHVVALELTTDFVTNNRENGRGGGPAVRKRILLAELIELVYIYYSTMLVHLDCCHLEQTTASDPVSRERHRSFLATAWYALSQHAIAERETLASIIVAMCLLKRNDEQTLDFVSFNLFNYKLTNYRESSIGVGTTLASRALSTESSSPIFLGDHRRTKKDELVHIAIPADAITPFLRNDRDLIVSGQERDRVTNGVNAWYQTWSRKLDKGPIAPVRTTNAFTLFQVNAPFTPLPHVREFTLNDVDDRKVWPRLGEIRCIQQKNPYNVDREMYASLFKMTRDGNLTEIGPPTLATERIHVCSSYQASDIVRHDSNADCTIAHQKFVRRTDDFYVDVGVLSLLRTDQLRLKPPRLFVRYDCSVAPISNTVKGHFEISHVFNVHRFPELSPVDVQNAYLAERTADDADWTEKILPLKAEDYGFRNDSSDNDATTTTTNNDDELSVRHVVLPVPIRKTTNTYMLRFRSTTDQMILTVNVSQIRNPFAKVVVRVHEKGEVQVLVRHFVDTSQSYDMVTVVTGINERTDYGIGKRLAKFPIDSSKFTLRDYSTDASYEQTIDQACRAFSAAG